MKPGNLANIGGKLSSPPRTASKIATNTKQSITTAHRLPRYSVSIVVKTKCLVDVGFVAVCYLSTTDDESHAVAQTSLPGTGMDSDIRDSAFRIALNLQHASTTLSIWISKHSTNLRFASGQQKHLSARNYYLLMTGLTHRWCSHYPSPIGSVKRLFDIETDLAIRLTYAN